MTRWFEYTGEGWQHDASAEWGPCRRLVEVLDDQLAARQIEVYANGEVLKYDRGHARDAWGQLLGLRFSAKEKWRAHFPDPRDLTPAEFEHAWRRAAPTVDQGGSSSKESG